MPQYRVVGASPAGANLIINTVGFGSGVSLQGQTQTQTQGHWVS